MFSNVKLKIKKSWQITSFTDGANKFRPTFSTLLQGRLLLPNRPETNMADKAAVIEKDVLAEMAVEDFWVVGHVQMGKEFVVVAVDGQVAVAAAVGDVAYITVVAEDEFVFAGICKKSWVKFLGKARQDRGWFLHVHWGFE